MSEFFNVTLRNDVIMDDGIISNQTTWSSEKIQKEIIEKRITKFEELEDVDVTNKEDKQIVAYSGDTGKFITVNANQIGESSGFSMKQISKMGIIGSLEKPRIVNIPINTIDFKVPQVNILKYDTENTQDLIETKNEFTNGESNDFVQDNMVVFDGKAYLKTEFVQDFKVIQDVETGVEYSTHIKKSDFKKIESFESFQDGVIEKLNIKAIPHDRLLIPKGDLNLSNVVSINSFNLTAMGNNLKIICSVDGGITWKTFKTNKWVNIGLNIEDVKTNGMSIELFNSINDIFWNELVTTKKIRFAYLFSMDNIANKEELDNLSLQFDGVGRWEQVRESGYKATYVSNTLLQVELYFNGDIKINYGY
ncbi:signal peptidase II [Clostridium sporogenes]|uniref:signal peptidase II n=1 Tax=Clostridium sporogenes TaxID=1509 RepID=UPI0013D7D173|nr:signal peptidase II [Clostridium sporogenes]NFF79166.1 signal peptidase II [Clostridium sporogenes]NFH40652.1 signal peptidase II [Clostridium sporogenes]